MWFDVRFFKNIAIGNLNGKYGHILQAPTGLKTHFLDLMDREIAKGEEGYIFAKYNSLTDRDFIDKLMEASQKGVTVKMVVRGICCILPGIPGYTENLEIHSIVGRFLEHTRLYIFGKGEDMEAYISSADLMTRNMERRVEIAVPVYDSILQDHLLHYADVVFRDNIKGRFLNSAGEYEFLPVYTGEEKLSSQDYYIRWAGKSQTASLHVLKKQKKFSTKNTRFFRLIKNDDASATSFFCILFHLFYPLVLNFSA